jgi:hypothetical protein
MASVAILDNQPVKTKKIENTNFSITKFKGSKRLSTVNEILPFRIRFTSIQIPPYSPSNVPPIPLQIIGFSNYIL